MRKLIRNLGRRWNDVWNRFVLRMRRKALILDLRQNFTPLETRQVLASSAFNPGLGALSVQLDNGETATLTQNLDQFVLDLPGTSSDLSGSIADLLRIEVAGVGPGNNGTFLWGGSSNNDFSLAIRINLSVQDLLSTDVNVKAPEIIIQGDSSSSSFTLINSGIVQVTNEPVGPFNFTDTFSITTTDSLADIRLDGDLQATSSATSSDVTFRTLGSNASIFIDGDIVLVGDPSTTPNSTLTIETLGTGGALGSNGVFLSSQINTTDDATIVSVRALGGSIDMAPSSSINAMDGTIEFQANTFIRFTGLSSTSTDVQAIRVISLTGELIDADSLGNDADATNGGILLNAVTGIGNSDALDVKVGVLSAINSTSGRISLNNQSSPGDGDLTLNIVENSFREIEIFNQSSGIQQSPTGRIVGNQVTLVADASVFDLANLDTPLRTSLNKSIVLTNSTNAIASFFGLATGEIRLTTQSDLNLVALRAQESVLSGPSIGFQSTPGINQIVIESLNSSITQGSGFPSGILTHSLSATASGGSVTLGNGSNNAQFITGSSQGDFLYTDANGFEVRGINSSSGNATLAAQSGSILQASGPANAITASRVSATASGGSVTLDNVSNNAQFVTGSSQGDFLYTDANGFEVQGINSSQRKIAIATVAGSITQGLSPSDGIIANKLSVLVDTESNPTPNQISIDGWGRNSILLNSANNDVGQVEAVASGSIQFVNKDSFQVGRIAAVAKDFVAGSVVSGVTAANEVVLVSREGGVSQAYSPVAPNYEALQAHTLRATVTTYAIFPDIDVVRLNVTPQKDKVLSNADLNTVVGDIFDDGSRLSTVYAAANASATKFLDTLNVNNPRLAITNELREAYSLDKYKQSFSVLVLNRGDLIVDGIKAVGSSVSGLPSNFSAAPNFLIASVASDASVVKPASSGDLLIAAGSRIEGLSLDKSSRDNSGLVLLAGRNLVFEKSGTLPIGQIGTAPILAQSDQVQTVFSTDLAAKFNNGGKGSQNILSTEFVIGNESINPGENVRTHSQQRVALDFGNIDRPTAGTSIQEQGFNVIVSYFDGATQAFSSKSQQGTSPPMPTNTIKEPVHPLPAIPTTNIAMMSSNSMDLQNSAIFQRTVPASVSSALMFSMLTPEKTLATNAIVRRSSDFFMFENVNSAFTDPSGVRDVTFQNQYIDNVKPLGPSASMMDPNPEMQMPQIWNGEMMNQAEILPLIRQDKPDAEIKAAQRTVEIGVWSIGYVDENKNGMVDAGDSEDESQASNSIDSNDPLVRIITYRIQEDELLEGIQQETIQRVVELIKDSKNSEDQVVEGFKQGGGFVAVEFIDGAPAEDTRRTFLITKDDIDSEIK